GQGFITGASGRNWAAYGHEIELAPELSGIPQALLSDPQTSGGLLVSCDPACLPEVLAIFARHGFAQATVLGQVQAREEGSKPLLVKA
ncbi:MAG: selenide, water dikinase SelD, partial [Burkholderiaceae bacterium]|nr:selenide, water dikinase SelD [Burkholderiaceae bacterium]